MKTAHLVFPHQLFEHSPLFEEEAPLFVIEEYLFFTHYPFHKQKLVYHRSSMKKYADFLETKQKEVRYISATEEESDIRVLIPALKKEGYEKLVYIDPADDWLQRRIEKGASENGMTTQSLNSPSFLLNREELKSFFRPDKKKFFQTTFYKEQRKQRRLLLLEDEQPAGGKWTFDTENRKKYPAKKTPPAIQFPDTDPYYEEARTYVETHFAHHYGSVGEQPYYPSDFEGAQAWFRQFLTERFAEFGPYEDAIVAEHLILNHSVLTPMLNTGLLCPEQIVEESLDFAEKNNIPLNSTEGFLRQIIGWREFMRGVYHSKGREQRTRNYWGFDRKIPPSFYTGTTGIPPIDQTIKKVLQTGYCHHIERLMVLGNFMLLCEFDPDEVYRWFMELFIDAYDWVMVSNVYGMSQFADGGLLSTKPYISGSNYLMKMSNYKKGDWQAQWDGLFWRFMDKQRDFFLKNPRLSMLIRTFDKMSPEKKALHLEHGEAFLNRLNAEQSV